MGASPGLLESGELEAVLLEENILLSDGDHLTQCLLMKSHHI